MEKTYEEIYLKRKARAKAFYNPRLSAEARRIDLYGGTQTGDRRVE